MICIRLFLLLLLIPSQIYSQDLSKVKSGAIDFVHNIHPMFVRSGCNTIECHGSPRNKMKFSMFAGFPENDYTTLVKEKGGRYINFVEPHKSLLIRKLKGGMVHQGGSFMNDSLLLKTVKQWIKKGALYDAQPGLKLERLNISCPVDELSLGTKHQLKIEAVYNNGVVEDVTRFCYLESQNPEIISVRENQSIYINNIGVTSVFARYLHYFGIASFNVSQPVPDTVKMREGSTEIDKLVNKRLKSLGIPPSAISTDEVFVRRIYLSLAGRIPTAVEAKNFILNKGQSKRAKLIDKLLESDDFADFLSLKWGDLLRCKSEFPSNLWPNAVQAYQRWMKSAVSENVPYDQFARELILSSGSNFRQPQVNFYRAFQERTPEQIAESASLIFMGNRMECARCHAHPKSQYRITDTTQLGAFFTQLKYKPTSEWKEEIVYVDKDKDLQLQHMRMPDNKDVKLVDGQDYRLIFADWLTSPQNPFFAKVMVNRIWYWLLGRGIVHEPDDFRETNPPVNPVLLTYLEKEFIDHDYDIKHVFSLILNSDTYQLSAKTNQWNKSDRAMFSHYPLRRLGAEQLIDAVSDITGVPDTYMSRVPEPFTFLPEDHRTVQMADGTITSPFLEMFGRPSRANSYEGNRNNELNMKQVLHFLNSSHIQEKIDKSPTIEELINNSKNIEELITQVYLTVLNRFPQENELKEVKVNMGSEEADKRKDINDLVWALMNTKEFIFNH